MTSNFLEQELMYWDDAIRDRPQDANVHVRRGMTRFKLAQIMPSIQDFDAAEQLEPRLTPYLWQRGLSFYYVDRFADGAKQFEIDLTVNSQDVEETVWRFLCIARFQGMDTARTTLLPVKHDPRPIMGLVYDLYAGTVTPETVLTAGQQEGIKGLFYSHLYVGLYYEAADDPDRAKAHITTAAIDYPLNDYMWHLAWVHKRLRSW